MDYFYLDEHGEKVGPCSVDELALAFHAHHLKRDSPVWCAGLLSWSKLEELDVCEVVVGMAALVVTSPPRVTEAPAPAAAVDTARPVVRAAPKPVQRRFCKTPSCRAPEAILQDNGACTECNRKAVRAAWSGGPRAFGGGGAAGPPRPPASTLTCGCAARHCGVYRCALHRVASGAVTDPLKLTLDGEARRAVLRVWRPACPNAVLCVCGCVRACVQRCSLRHWCVLTLAGALPRNAHLAHRCRVALFRLARASRTTAAQRLCVLLVFLSASCVCGVLAARGEAVAHASRVRRRRRRAVGEACSTDAAVVV
jgi:hypothetical protein